MPALHPSRLLLLASCLTAAGFGAAAGRPPLPATRDAGVAVQPRSVQLHVHSSFSEGPGSIASGAWEATQLGLDAIWWSDHDWRLAYRKHVSTFSFDGFHEPLETGENWIPSHVGERGYKGLLWLPLAASFTLAERDITPPPNAFAGEGALHLCGASASSDFQPLAAAFRAIRARTKRNLSSGVVLRLALRVDEASPQARPFVDVILSKHVTGGATTPEELHLHYYAADKDAVPVRAGSVYAIPLPYVAGEWQELALDLGADVAAGFPDVEVGDNSLAEIVFGVESKQNAVAEGYFDALRIEHRPNVDGLLGEQRELLAKVEARVPGVRQLQGEEVSYFRHLNVFSVAPELPDYDRLVAESGLADARGWVSDVDALEDFVSRRVVEDVHAGGGLVSLNHAFGTDGHPDPRPYQEVRDEIAAAGAWGVDVLEVGYRLRAGRRLEEFLRLWDELAAGGLPLIGVGVSDHHGSGPPGAWASKPNNFVTWIYAPSLDQADLLAGLTRGRAFFGDLTSFDGWLDLATDSGFRMGQCVVTDRRRIKLDIHVSGLVAGDRLRLIRSGALVHEETATGPDYDRRVEVIVARKRGSLFRLEVLEANGQAKVFSNPVWFLRQGPDGGLPPERAAFDVAGARSLSIEAFRLKDVNFVAAGTGGTLKIVGEGFGGTVVVDFAAASPPTQVRFRGYLSGSGSLNGSLLELSQLAGAGWIEIDL